jgi:hypothetical protein
MGEDKERELFQKEFHLPLQARGRTGSERIGMEEEEVPHKQEKKGGGSPLLRFGSLLKKEGSFAGSCERKRSGKESLQAIPEKRREQ